MGPSVADGCTANTYLCEVASLLRDLDDSHVVVIVHLLRTADVETVYALACQPRCHGVAPKCEALGVRGDEVAHARYTSIRDNTAGSKFSAQGVLG
jgi:hypothetical protein